jgi:hypothetical protein
MEMKSCTSGESNIPTANEGKTEWSAPKLSRLDIQRTMAGSGFGADLGHVTT